MSVLDDPVLERLPARLHDKSDEQFEAMRIHDAHLVERQRSTLSFLTY